MNRTDKICEAEGEAAEGEAKSNYTTFSLDFVQIEIGL